MQVLREIREIDSDELIIHLPDEFKHKTVEVIIQAVEDHTGKPLSKEAEEFLALGGSGCWEGDLNEMRNDR